MSNTVIRRVLRHFSVVAVVVIVAGIVATIWLGNAIFSPPRKALQASHLERLQHPAIFGLRIRSRVGLQGDVPYLLVEPDAQAGVGERGRKFRQQVAVKQLALPAYGAMQGTIVLLHGRNIRKEDLLPVAERFVAAGFCCLIPDLPGHGESPLAAMAFGGSPFERSLPRLIVADAREHFALPTDPTALWGISMGGAVAVSAASESPHSWNALVVVSSFDALLPVMDRQVPTKWKPAAALAYPLLDTMQWLRHRPTISTMQPRQWARQVKIPTLVVHGDRDAYIPIVQGRHLYDAIASTEKRWVTVPGGGHANVLGTAMLLYAEMGGWLLQTLRSKNGYTKKTDSPPRP